VALCAACWWVIDLALLRGGAPHPLDDTWEYGLVARSLLAGHGFRTPLIHPPLWGFRDASSTVPLLVHGPLLPLIGAPLIAWLGPGALDGAAWLAAAFAVLAAVFTARAARRIAGTAGGVVAAAIVTTVPLMMRMVHHDIAPAAGACFMGLLLDLLSRPRRGAFAAGLATGLGALVRPELLLVAPGAAYALGAARLASYALGVAVVMAPWAWRTFLVTGSPAFNLSSYLLIAYTPSYPGLSPLWAFSIPPARLPAVLAQMLPELPGKWLYFAPRAVKHFLLAPGPGFGLVSALGWLDAVRRPHARRWAIAALATALIPFVLATTTEPSERIFAVFLPLWAAGVVYAARGWATGSARARAFQLVLLVPLLPYALQSAWFEAHHSADLRAWLVAERAALASRGAPELRGRLLFSDTPDLAAWTTGRPTIATTREGYLALPASANGATGSPVRGEALDEWFHANVRARIAPTSGGSAAGTAAPPGAR
jgi:hypothetical protein